MEGREVFWEQQILLSLTDIRVTFVRCAEISRYRACLPLQPVLLLTPALLLTAFCPMSPAVHGPQLAQMGHFYNSMRNLKTQAHNLCAVEVYGQYAVLY